MRVDPRDCDPMPPEVSPDDVWSDPVWPSAADSLPLPALPKKRATWRRKERPENMPAGWHTDPEDSGDFGFEVTEISGRVLRLAPEEPAVERVPRQVTFVARQTTDGKHGMAGETREWGRPARHSLLWVCGAGSMIVAVVVGALVMLPRVNRANAIQAKPGDTQFVIDPVDRDDGTERVASMMLRLGEAESLYDAFTAAKSVEDLLPLLRDPAAVEPLLRATGMTERSPRSMTDSSWTAQEKNGVVYGLLDGDCEDFSKFQAYFVDHEGGLRIDWKATTGYGTADFTALAEGRGNPEEIRGWISPVDFYTLAFPESGFHSYRFVSPDQSVALWVYVELGSDVASILDSWLRGGGILDARSEAAKVTLRLAPAAEGALPSQWRLVELLHKEWIGP